MRLFKFRALADRGLAHALDMMIQNRIFMSTCNSWNDPQEGGFTFAQSDLSINASACAEAGKRLWKVVDQVRCSSFAVTALNPLLWAHYAGGFAGVAFEYEIPEDSPSLTLLPITYGDTPCISLATCEEIIAGRSQPWHHGILRTKRSYWSYEEEVRLFWHPADSYLENLPPLSVILGGRYSLELRLLERIANQFRITVKFLNSSRTGFEVVE